MTETPLPSEQALDQPVNDAARAEIGRRLEAITAEEGIEILLAVESGSRAWGFHSPDSDYDVRFIYRRRLSDYLSLAGRRDVIERPIVDEIDLAGWDLDKALTLMMRGNSVLSEWLVSPLVYAEAPGFRQRLEVIGQKWRACFTDAAHYYGLLQGQRARYLEGRDSVKLKRYFYVVRPALALHWLRTRSEHVLPMDLRSLLAGVDMPRDARSALEDLRAAKAKGLESAEGPRIAPLDSYIAEQAAWGLASKGKQPTPDPHLFAETDGFFQSTIMAPL